MRIIVCPVCNHQHNYQEWSEQDTPDCFKCGYPLHPDLDQFLPKQGLFSRALSLFPVTSATYAYKLADVSVYNGTEGTINFDLFFSKFNGVIARSSSGANYYDPMFEVWKREANKRGCPFGSYHYFKPDKNLDNQAGLVEQAQQDGKVNLYPALDVETNPWMGVDGGKQLMGDAIFKMLKRIQTLLPEATQMIYTSPGFWNANVYRNDFAKGYPLWVAHWTEASEPTIPYDWSAIHNPIQETFWQKRLEPAAQYGLPSDKVDIDYFRGTKDEFFKLFGIYPYENSTVPPTTGWPKPEQPIRFSVVANELNVRNGPGTRYPIVDKIKSGTEVYAFDVSAPNEVWIEIAPGKWSALKYNGSNYMKLVE